MCCRLSHLRVAPKDQGLQGLARPLASCCEHTDVCRQINQIRAAPKGRHVPKVRSTRCCCKHTRACCGIIKLRISPKDQRLQRFGRPPAAVGTHMCVAAKINAELHRGPRFTLLAAYICALQNRRIHGCTQGACVLQNRSIKGCTHRSRLQMFWPTNCCFEHTHVCCRMCHFRVAPKSPELQWSGRPIAAASIHMCVAEYIN